MRCLITAFNAFGEFAQNPSELAIKAINCEQIYHQDLDETVKMETLVLESCCEKLWQPVEKAVKETANEALVIIHTGLASSRDAISLERFALNTRDYRIADNYGHMHNDEYLVDSAENALRTNLPILNIENHLRQNNFYCNISNNAGTFLCNEIYFKSLHHFQSQYFRPLEKSVSVIFVHLPDPLKYKNALLQSTYSTENNSNQIDNNYANTDGEQKINTNWSDPQNIDTFNWSISEYARALKEIASVSSHWLLLETLAAGYRASI